MEWHKVIIKPLLTEKVTMAMENKDTKCVCYPFDVNRQATKTEIKQAFEDMASEVYDRQVKVLRVNTMHVGGKERRRGRTSGRSRNWKKAFIFLPVEQALEIF